MVFENGVKNIQAAAYDGARTVYENEVEKILNYICFRMCLWNVIMVSIHHLYVLLAPKKLLAIVIHF